LIRFVFTRATEALAEVREAAEAFGHGVALCAAREIRAGGMAARISPGQDAMLWRGGEATLEDLRALEGQIELRSRVLALCCQVLGGLLDIFADAALGPLGWVLILARLLEASRGIRDQVAALAAL